MTGLGRLACLGIGLLLAAASAMPVAMATPPPVREATRRAGDPEFTGDIVPVLTKLGCNAGSCHGSAAGRGGFKLSLYGSSPRADFEAIASQFEGRRVNLDSPEDSLILLKPTEAISHGGGYLIEEDDPAYRLLARWIEQGADFTASRRLERITISPSPFGSSASFGSSAPVGSPAPFRSSEDGSSKVGQSVTAHVTAHYDAGPSRDVTAWTVLVPEDDSAVSIAQADGVSQSNTLVAHRPGRHIIVARYLDQVVPIQWIVPYDDAGKPRGTTDTGNWIDQHVDQRLTQLGLSAAQPAGDDQWVRRVTLDLTGRLPAGQQVTAADRAEYIDKLVGSDAFADYWTWQLARWLRIGSRQVDAPALAAYQSWLRRQVRDDVGLDQIAESLIVSAGDTHKEGPPNFYLTTDSPGKQAELVSEVFMGSRLRCANCHDHPLDRWTQDDYHGLAALFAGVQVGRIVSTRRGGEVIHPATGEPARPRIPGGDDLTVESNLTAAGELRDDFARWLTDAENPYFAKAIVNRLWCHLMGRGLVHPVDDFRSTNPATHPELLDALATDFIGHGYRIRRTLTLIASSQAYARSARSGPDLDVGNHFYARAASRPLDAEVLADAISDVLGVWERYGDQPLGTRAVTLASPKLASRTLDILGRCGRTADCQGDVRTSGGLKQKLHLLNGDLLNARIARPEGRLAKSLAQKKGPMRIVDDFYRAALNRSPQPRELAFWKSQFADDESIQTQEVLEDFVWSLLTCDEFVTNH